MAPLSDVPGVDSRVILASPYGHFRIMHREPQLDRLIENGRSGYVVGEASGGALSVRFAGELGPCAVPIHWLTLA